MCKPAEVEAFPGEEDQLAPEVILGIVVARPMFLDVLVHLFCPRERTFARPMLIFGSWHVDYVEEICAVR